MIARWSRVAARPLVQVHFCLVCLVSSGAWTQTAPRQQLLRGQTHVESVQSRPATAAKNGRFLGWKFATQSGQDATKWHRERRTKDHPLEFSVLGAAPGTSQAGLAFGTVGFGFRQGLPTGYIPTAVVEGDFNEDGHTDVAVSNGGDNSVYVLLGNGDGTFKVPAILYTRGQSPDWIAAVSLSNNGHLDLVVTDADSKTVEIFLGQGNGTFQAGGEVSLAQTPTFVLSGDFNGDGKPDLAVGLVVDPTSTEPQFEILLGDGAGGFAGTVFPPPLTSFGSPIPTGWLVSGDLNNDGSTDLVTTVTGGFAITYLNQAGKGFSQGSAFGPGGGPMVVGLGDMDEDGCLDAVELSGFGLLTIAKGTCDGNFTQGPATAAVGDVDPAVKVVDLDGDGHLDVVGSSAFYFLGGPGYGYEGGYLVSVLKGDGHGNAALAKVYRGGTDAYSLVVTDFTGDHKPEILTVDSTENQASLFVNDGTGNYDGPQGESIGYTQGVTNAPIPNTPIETADLNGDGKPDLLLIEDGMFDSTQPSQLTVMLNDGTGRFLSPVRTPIMVGPLAPYPLFVAGAFRSASKPDVIYVSRFGPSNVVAFFPGNGDGTFGTPTTLATLPDPLRLVAGDFNRDGKLDFVVCGTDSDGPGNQEFDVFLGNGDGTFTHLPPATFPPTGSPQQLFAVDLNHDGKLDLLIGNNVNGGFTVNGDDLIVAFGNGDGTFQTPKTLIPHFGAVAVADLNRDGYPDLIQARDPSEDITQSIFYSPAITVYLGGVNGTFQQQPSYHLPGGVALISLDPPLVGDFNGDGILDIGYRYLSTQFAALVEARLRLLQGIGDGTFSIADHFYQLQSSSNPVGGADFNGDGADDLVELVGYTSSFHTIEAAPGPTLDIVLDSNPILAGKGSATVALNLPAATAEDVTLSASDPAIALPASVHFNAGQQTQDFSFTLGSGYDTSHVVALYAKLGNQTAVAFGSKPNSNLTVGVTASLLSGVYPLFGSIAITPGESFSLAVQLLSEGGYDGTFSSFQCSGLPAGSACSFADSSVTVPPGGRAQVTFVVATAGSTPQGTYTVQVMSTDGFFPAPTSFQLGIGDFSFSIDPTTVVVGPTGNAAATITTSSTNGLGEELNFTCAGLPSGTQCGAVAIANTSGGTVGFGVSHNQLAANDYPFQVTGTANIVSHSINAVLRVGDYTASLDKTTAILSAGQSAKFNVTLTSVNHYTSSITVFCNPAANTVTCSASPVPATLSDGGTTTVQLTATNPSTKTGIRPTDWGSLSTGYVIAFLVPMSLLFIRRKARPVLALIAVVVVIGMVSCGGRGGAGTSSGGGGGGGGSGSGNSQTVNLSVAAQAAESQNDMDNQKTIGPIVITLQ